MKVDEIEVERLNDLPRAMLLLDGMKLHGSQLRFRLHKPGLLPPATQEGGRVLPPAAQERGQSRLALL